MQSLPMKLFTVGLTCLFGTIVIFWVLVPAVIQISIAKFIRLEEGNEVWEVFTDIDAEIYMKIYVFNVTNPDEISEGGSPKLQQIGPYVYEEKRSNYIISENPENNTLKYQPTILFHFRPDLSNGTEEDEFTMLNAPVVAIGSELETWSKMIRYMAKYYLKAFGEKLFVQRTIKQALFEGVHVQMIESISNLLGRDYLPNNTFGFLSEKNGTLPFEYEIISGVQDNTNFGKILSFNGKTEMDIWGGSSCNMINGSDSTLYPPSITRNTVLRGFVADICRSVHLEYKKDDEYDGIKGYRFEIPSNFFDVDSPNNECFCKEEDKSKCPLSGAVSIAPCKWGAPLYISFPYFLNGNTKYNEEAGLDLPNEELHSAFAILEPTTGIVLKAKSRMQFNIRMKKSRHIPELYNVKDVVFPLFWVEEEATQSQKQLSVIHSRMVTPLMAAEIGKWSMLSISTILTSIGVVIFMLRSKNKKPVEYY